MTNHTNKTPAGATQADTLAAMQILLTADVPVLLWGDPGTGKTHTIEAFARRCGWDTVSVIASIHDPTDFAGLPIRTDASWIVSVYQSLIPAVPRLVLRDPQPPLTARLRAAPVERELVLFQRDSMLLSYGPCRTLKQYRYLLLTHLRANSGVSYSRLPSQRQ